MNCYTSPKLEEKLNEDIFLKKYRWAIKSPVTVLVAAPMSTGFITMLKSKGFTVSIENIMGSEMSTVMVTQAGDKYYCADLYKITHNGPDLPKL